MGNDDLEGVTCSVVGCWQPATGMAWITLKLAPLFDDVREEERLTIDFPRCLTHAVLLGAGGELIELDDNQL